MREKGVGQGEAPRKTEQRDNLPKGGWGENRKRERRNKRYQDWLRFSFKLILVEALKKTSSILLCLWTFWVYQPCFYRRQLMAIIHNYLV